jgi:hypothetical protein
VRLFASGPAERADATARRLGLGTRENRDARMCMQPEFDAGTAAPQFSDLFNEPELGAVYRF